MPRVIKGVTAELGNGLEKALNDLVLKESASFKIRRTEYFCPYSFKIIAHQHEYILEGNIVRVRISRHKSYQLLELLQDVDTSKFIDISSSTATEQCHDSM